MHSHFKNSSEMFSWVHVWALSGPLKDIYRVIPKLLLCYLDCVLKDVSVQCCVHLSLDAAAEKVPQHDAATTILHCRDGIGQVKSGACFPPDITLGIQPKEF